MISLFNLQIWFSSCVISVASVASSSSSQKFDTLVQLWKLYSREGLSFGMVGCWMLMCEGWGFWWCLLKDKLMFVCHYQYGIYNSKCVSRNCWPSRLLVCAIFCPLIQRWDRHPFLSHRFGCFRRKIPGKSWGFSSLIPPTFAPLKLGVTKHFVST